MEEGSQQTRLLNMIDLDKPVKCYFRIFLVNTPLPVLAASVMCVLLGITGDLSCQQSITNYYSLVLMNTKFYCLCQSVSGIQ